MSASGGGGADAFDEEEEGEEAVETAISIDEYLTQLESQELEADLVLGGDEGKECTYSKGYMNRQAIFSCLTCTPCGDAGVCTACSLSCHDGHNIVELWTKRNFRCDCGNSKFGHFFCNLFPTKDVDNPLNSYNHNFKGFYCTCLQPYPDPNPDPDPLHQHLDMIQCIVCEDWFHEHHLGLPSPSQVPKDDLGDPLYEDFICNPCSHRCSFLMQYPQTLLPAAPTHVPQPSLANNKDKGLLLEEDIQPDFRPHHLTPQLQPPFATRKLFENGAPSNPSVGGNHDSDVLVEQNISPVQSNDDGGINRKCLLGENQMQNLPFTPNKPLFLSKNWRDILCRCEKCLDTYKQKNVSYLIEKEDSIAEYEKIAKLKREEKLQQAEGESLNFFNNLGHVEKMEVLSGIADFKDEFRSFLESHDSSKPITASDVQEIFANLAKKRRRE